MPGPADQLSVLLEFELYITAQEAKDWLAGGF